MTSMQIVRFRSPNNVPTLALARNDSISAYLPAEVQLHDLLAMRSTALRSYLTDLPPDNNASQPTLPARPVLSSLALLAPIDGETEVWAAGVTYTRSMDARREESETPDVYSKVYAGCCALGPAITMAWDLPDPYALTMHLSIERAGRVHWQGQTSTSELKRRLDELTRYLFLQDEFPSGTILCTGTALVPDPPFTLQHGDIAEITIDTLGTLRNPVVKGNIPYC